MIKSYAQDSPELRNHYRLCHRHKYSADAPLLWEAMLKQSANSYAS